MDSGEGPSRAKRNRKAVDYGENEDEELLFGDVGSDDEFNPGSDDEESPDGDQEDEELPLRPSFPIIDISLRPTQHQGPNVEFAHNQPSSSGSTSLWSTTGEITNLHFTQLNAFYGQPEGTDPIDYFNFFFDESLLNMICDETNKQAERIFTSEKTRESSRITEWRELKVDELKIFLGLLFHMGTIPLSRVQDYWKKDRLFSIPIFGEQMSRNRFLLIMRCLHFTSDTESQDPLFKIRKVIDYFNEKMKNCYYPAKELSLDESMILWRGRLYFRQFIKNKRHKYGIKLYMLTEPDGLILKFRVYAGGKDTDVTGKGHAEKVVMQLLREKLNNGHAVYMDNYYNSFHLAKNLLNEKTYCTGTLRKDLKDNPKEVIQARIKKGENVSRFREAVHVGKWKDKRDVVYITTEYNEKMVPVTNKRGQTKDKPEAIARYNDFMSGVDRQDQLLSFYPCERKTVRWYLKVAIHTFQLLFINSFKIYNKYSGQTKMRLYDYRLSVINSLLPEKNVSTPGPSRSRSAEQRHKPSRIVEKSSKGKIKRKQCRQCYKSKQRKDSYWHCLLCTDQPGLCVECFDDYHAQL